MSSTDVADTHKPARNYSCVRCFERKVKCDRDHPCSACVRSKVNCIFRVPTAPRRRKKRTREELLLARLVHYEYLLKANGISTEAVSIDEDFNETWAGTESFRNLSLVTGQPFISGSPSHPPSGQEATKNSSASTTATQDKILENPGTIFLDRGKSTFMDSNLYQSLTDEWNQAEDILPDSSDDESILGAEDDHPLGIDLLLGPVVRLPTAKSLHPTPDKIFKLWQVFQENVNPILKIIHVPTLQTQLLNVAFDLDKVDKHFEPLMFGIYAMAVLSLTDAESQEILQEDKTTLFGRYLCAIRYGLMNTRFLGTSELSVLQAFVLYVVATRHFYRPRSTWVLAGVASRIAQGMGLHKDGSTLGLPPFESEMRRRLFWQIAILDGTSAELAGSGRSGELWPAEVKCPMNVNDIELWPGMTENPPEHDRVTEMSGFLIRYEVRHHFLKFVRKSWFAPGSSISSSSAEEIENSITELENNLNEKFLGKMDPSQPDQFHCLIIGRSALDIIRFYARHPRYRQMPDSDDPMPEKCNQSFNVKVDKDQLPLSERNVLFDSGIKVLKLDSLAHDDPVLRRFQWHITSRFQWHCFIYVLNELRFRTEGLDAELGWKAVDEVYSNHEEIIRGASGRPLYVAVGNLTLKAWNARERAWAQKRGDTSAREIPHYIQKLKKARSKSNTVKDNLAPTLGFQAVPQIDALSATALNSSENNSTSSPDTSAPAAESSSSSLGDTPMDDVVPVDWSQWDSLLQDFELPSDSTFEL